MLLAFMLLPTALRAEEDVASDVGDDKGPLFVTESGEYDVEAHRAQRGLVTLDNAVVPKGQWIVGATANYSTHSNKNYSFTALSGIYSVGYTIKASPILAYTIKDNLSAGVRFQYSRSLLNLDNAQFSFGEEGTGIEIGLEDYYALQQSYTAMLIIRQYIPIGQSKRFSLFGELQLEYGSTTSKFAYDKPVSGTFSKGYNVGIGIVPGIVAWVTNDVAFEVTIGVVGLGYSKQEQIHNQVYYGEMNTAHLTYGLNLFSIGLGVAFYL